MKAKLLLVLTCLLSAAALLLSNSAGEGYVQGVDRTGSPISSGFCNNCHGEGNFQPITTLALLQDNQVVTSYKPGQNYTLKVRIDMPFGAAADYGFQTVALTGSDNHSAGSFGKVPDGVRLTKLSNNRIYAEHSRPSLSNVILIPWVAPAAGTGTVSFYAAGMASNGSGAADGQGASVLKNTFFITESTSTATTSLIGLDFKVDCYPNPIDDELHVQLTNEVAIKNLTIEVSSLDGKKNMQVHFNEAGSLFQTVFSTEGWKNGLYVISLSMDQQKLSKLVYKK
jgi:hypothetical protein